MQIFLTEDPCLMCAPLSGAKHDTAVPASWVPNLATGQHAQVPVGRDYRVSAAAVKRAMTRNTVLVVASSPCFPHGVIDDVAGIARVRAGPLSCGAIRFSFYHAGCAADVRLL